MTPEFECKNCGTCCSQIPLIVAGDVYHIIRHVKVRPEEIVHLYEMDDFEEDFAPDDQLLQMENGVRVMGMKRVDDRCVFRTNGRCAIYAHRPLMCAMHPYMPRDPNEDVLEFNVQCHHGCKGLTKGPMSLEHLKRFRLAFDRFSEREWDYDDMVKRWNRKDRKDRSERAFFKFLGLIE